MKTTLLTRVEDYGQVICGFCAEGIRKDADLSLALCAGTRFYRPPFLRITREEGKITALTEPFPYDTDFVFTADGCAVTRESADEVRCDVVDRFSDCRTKDLRYRLYRPEKTGPAPLIVFLHGGGECGTDNTKQLIGAFGAAHLAELFPDVCVMAPQTPVDERKKRDEADGARSYAEARMYGWTPEYMRRLGCEIRSLIEREMADPGRIYVTGAGRGGGGCFIALAENPDLFAAAVPVSPRITPEVTDACGKVWDRPIWITAPYVDEVPVRNKYLVEAFLQMKEKGGRDLHLTLYGPEELARYGIGTREGETLEEKLKENHRAWILTYHNEGGVLDWMLSRKREERSG